MFSLFSKVNFRRAISWLTPCLAHLSIQAAPIRWGDAWKTGMNSSLSSSFIGLSSSFPRLSTSFCGLTSSFFGLVIRFQQSRLKLLRSCVKHSWSCVKRCSSCIKVWRSCVTLPRVFSPHFIPTLPHAVIHLISSLSLSLSFWAAAPEGTGADKVL